MLFVLNSVRRVIITDLHFDFILHFIQQNFFFDFNLGWGNIKLVSFPRGGYHCGGTETGYGYHSVLAIDCGHGAGSGTGRGGASTRAHFDNICPRRYCLACKSIINLINKTLQKHQFIMCLLFRLFSRLAIISYITNSIWSATLFIPFTNRIKIFYYMPLLRQIFWPLHLIFL